MAVLLEDIQGKLKGVAEVVSGISKKADETNQRLEKVEENTNLVPAIQAAVTEQSVQLNDHETRITELQAA